jgi:hypothetical protein
MTKDPFLNSESRSRKAKMVFKKGTSIKNDNFHTKKGLGHETELDFLLK